MKLPDRELVKAYQLTFGAGHAQPVLGDLKRMVGASVLRRDTEGRIDPIAMAVAEGARILVNYIDAMIRMDESENWRAEELRRQMKGAQNG
jgi:hypothetical protein